MAGLTTATGNELFVFGTPQAVLHSAIGNTLQIIPNPTTGNALMKVSLQQAERINIIVTDGSGRVVWESGIKEFATGEYSVVLPISKLPAGLYFYQLANASGASFAGGRLMKQ